MGWFTEGAEEVHGWVPRFMGLPCSELLRNPRVHAVTPLLLSSPLSSLSNRLPVNCGRREAKRESPSLEGAPSPEGVSVKARYHPCCNESPFSIQGQSRCVADSWHGFSPHAHEVRDHHRVLESIAPSCWPCCLPVSCQLLGRSSSNRAQEWSKTAVRILPC